MSRGAIFNWFPSKEELFIALAARDNARLAAPLAQRRASRRSSTRSSGTIPTGSPCTSSSAAACGRTRSSASDGRRSRRTTHGSAAAGGSRRRSPKDGCARTSRRGDRASSWASSWTASPCSARSVRRPVAELLHLLTSTPSPARATAARIRLRGARSVGRAKRTPSGMCPAEAGSSRGVGSAESRLASNCSSMRTRRRRPAARRSPCPRSRASRGTGSQRPSRATRSTFPWPAW